VVVDVLPYESSAWLVGDVDTFKPPSDAVVVNDSRDRPVVLFRSAWSKNFACDRNPQHDFKDMGLTLESRQKVFSGGFNLAPDFWK
jgi:peptide chain release factor 3